MFTKDFLNFNLLSDFTIVYSEKIPGRGEDAYSCSINDKSSYVGVFDGVGGSGAKKYACLYNHTGAYIASRQVALSVKNWFEHTVTDNCNLPNNDLVSCFSEESACTLKRKIKDSLSILNAKLSSSQQLKLKSSFSKEFPTTMSSIVVVPEYRQNPEGESGFDYNVSCYWAGDSRSYYLDQNGLHQITNDDTDVEDALDNIYADGLMNNVIYHVGDNSRNRNQDFVINYKRLVLNGKFITFATTDGCFGYISSPMEFEYYLLECLMNSDSVQQFNNNLHSLFKKYAEDDFSFAGLIYGYESFEDVKEYFKERFQTMKAMCEDILELEKTKGKVDTRKEIWLQSYKDDYCKYL